MDNGDVADIEQFSAQSAARLETATQALKLALDDYVKTVTQLHGGSIDVQKVFEANDVNRTGPDLTLRSDRGLMWATLRQRDKSPEHVRFLTQAETVLGAEVVLEAVADLIEGTVRRLEDKGITDTLLQGEWAAIQQADRPERDYCLVAAAWGQDPYDTPADIEQVLLNAGIEVGPALLADLSRAVTLDRVADSTGWLLEATRSLTPRAIALPSVGQLDWSSAAGIWPA